MTVTPKCAGTGPPCQAMLLHAIFHNLSLVIVGFTFVVLTRHVLHTMSTRLILRGIPGPKPSSFLWGEEWELYHSVPGSLYLDWHKRFGKLVAFSGAFGVSIFSIPLSYLLTIHGLESSYFCHRPMRHSLHPWCRCI